MTGQHVIGKGGLFGAKDTLWGKCLSVFIAIAFALSMISIVPAANAEGEEADAATIEMEHDALFNGEDAPLVLHLDDEGEDNAVDTPETDNNTDATADGTDELDADVQDVEEADANEMQPAEEAGDPATQVEDDWIDFIGSMALPAGSVKTVNSDKNTYDSGTVFLFCTSTHLGSIDLSTSAFPALGMKTGVAVGDLLGSKATIKQEKAGEIDTYEFRYVRIQTKTDGQVGGNYRDMGANAAGAAASHLRYSAKDGAWQYLLAGTEDNWVSLTNDNVIIFYYSQIYDLVNKNDYQDASIVNFETQDWGSTTLRGKGQYSSDSGQGAALIQLYDMNGSKVGSPMTIYYWAPCADKRGCTVTVGDNWEVKNVALKATQVDKITHENDTVGQATIPTQFDELAPVADINNFIIPFHENHLDANGNKIDHTNSGTDARHNNVIIVGVQVSAKATEQDLIVNYYDADARDEGKLVKIADTQSVRAAGFKGNGVPQWTNYVSVVDGIVNIKDAYVTEDSNLISIPTDLLNQSQTVSLLPKGLSEGYITPYVDAEIVGGNTLNVYFDRDVLGNNPDEPGDTDYSDGIADKHQAIVTYGAVGGTLSMMSANSVTISGKTQFDYVVTLADENGNHVKDGSYTLLESDVPEGTAAAGFWGETATWSPKNDETGTPAGSQITKDGARFIAYWGNGAINYFYDGELVSSVVANKAIGETIQFDTGASANKWREHDGHRYVLDYVEVLDGEGFAVVDTSEESMVAVEVRVGDPGQNIINVHYAIDETGNDPNPDDPEDIEYSDGVPDKYQLVVSYAAVNGKIEGAAKVVLDKLNTAGKHDIAGTATLSTELIPAASPNEGYGPDGSWDPQTPIDGLTFTEDSSFVITYDQTPADSEPPAPDDPVDPQPVDPEDPEPVEPDDPEPVIPEDPDPTDPENPEPVTPEQPVPGPIDPTPGLTDPTPSDTPDEPADNPGTTPDETPADEGGAPDVPPTPTEIPGADVEAVPADATPAPGAAPAAPGAAIATIVDDGTPLAAPDGETIDDEGNPLASFHDIHCWTHWLMILGIIVTVVYGVAVLHRRRSDVNDMDDFEGTISGKRRDTKSGISATDPAIQAM